MKKYGKPYSRTTKPELEAIHVLEYILDSRVISFINRLDKIPNHDGIIELTNEQDYVIGELKVQVKKENPKNPKKYSFEIDFFHSCSQSLNPVIVFLVDTINDIAYWDYFDYSTLEKYKAATTKEISISFSDDKKIQKGKSDYLDNWTAIIEERRKQFIDYKALKEKNVELEAANKLSQSFQKPIHSISTEQLISIQTFIKAFNSALDGDFSTIKKVFYPNYWKIGIAYLNYNTDSLAYALYPIKWGENDLLIREVLGENIFNVKGIKKSALSGSNPIQQDPKQYAYSLIKKDVIEVIKKQYAKLLSVELANEYLFAFIDFSCDIFNVQKKDRYQLKDIINRIHCFYPIWYEEWAKMNEQKIEGNDILLSMGFLSSKFHDDNAAIITKSAIKRYKANELSSLSVYFNSESRFDEEYLMESMHYLRTNETLTINRQYPPRQISSKRGFIWENFPPKTLYLKTESVFKTIPKLIDTYIDVYFPKLSPHIKYFSGFDMVILNVIHKNENKSFQDCPSIHEYYFKCIDISENTIQVYLNDFECPVKIEDVYEYYEKNIIINGKIYKLIRCSTGYFDIFFDQFPLQNYLHKILLDRFEEYFKSREKLNFAHT